MFAHLSSCDVGSPAHALGRIEDVGLLLERRSLCGSSPFVLKAFTGAEQLVALREPIPQYYHGPNVIRRVAHVQCAEHLVEGASLDDVTEVFVSQGQSNPARSIEESDNVNNNVAVPALGEYVVHGLLGVLAL